MVPIPVIVIRINLWVVWENALRACPISAAHTHFREKERSLELK
jgi:hypothetical protein